MEILVLVLLAVVALGIAGSLVLAGIRLLGYGTRVFLETALPGAFTPQPAMGPTISALIGLCPRCRRAVPAAGEEPPLCPVCREPVLVVAISGTPQELASLAGVPAAGRTHTGYRC